MEGGHRSDGALELVGRRQEGRAEVEGVRVRLPKAGAGHDDEARRVEQLERVELVRGAPRLARGGDRLDGQLDAGEEVERALGGRARDAGQLIEGVGEPGTFSLAS